MASITKPPTSFLPLRIVNLYEGMITILAEINGEPHSLDVGSAQAPLRWTVGRTAGPHGGDFFQSLGDGYDWNPLSKQWIQVTTGLPDWIPN